MSQPFSLDSRPLLTRSTSSGCWATDPASTTGTEALSSMLSFRATVDIATTRNRAASSKIPCGPASVNDPLQQSTPNHLTLATTSPFFASSNAKGVSDAILAQERSS